MSYLLLQADARKIPLADGSVHCVVTSVPYWGLRDYGVDGQLGLEASPSEYIAGMMAVFREVRRVLHPTGTLWLNIGDSFNSSPSNQHNGAAILAKGGAAYAKYGTVGRQKRSVFGLKPKDLCMIPHRLAIALQEDGWYVRMDCVWAKPNPMPESVTDRPTKSHEYVFLLAKSERYFFDADAVREGWADHRCGSPGGKKPAERNVGGRTDGFTRPAQDWTAPEGRSGRNMRSVLTIPTEAYPGAHFATYPRRLVEPLIRAGTSQRGVCPECGAPHERVVERTPMVCDDDTAKLAAKKAMGLRTAISGTMLEPPRSTTLGWRPTCSHGHEPVPAVVLDPFAGSCTTLVVATALGRRAIGLDLSREYLEMGRRRVERPHARVPRPRRDEPPLPLFAERG